MRLNVVAAAAVAAFAVACSGCGFTVHMLNSHRALSTLASTPRDAAFMQNLYENVGSVFAGQCCAD